MPAFQQNMATSVPASVPQSVGLDTGSQLERILANNSDELQKLATAATTPVAGGHVNQVPLSMQRPDSPYTSPNLDHREVVGAGNARAQGIGNSIKSVASLLSNVEIAKQNRTKNEVASATQQLLTAQAGYDQAKQVLTQDPNNADAKAAMERNKASMNGILSNDKLRKQIAKGFNIDFTDPQANKTLEHEGVAAGKKQAQEHLDYAEQFNRRTPVEMGPNVVAQQKYAAALAQQKALQEFAEKRMTYEAAMAGHQATLQAKYVEQETELQKQQVQIRAQNEQRKERFSDRVKMLGYQDVYATRRLNREADIAVERERRILDMKDARPELVQKESEQSAREWDARQETAQGRVDTANNNLVNIEATGKKPGDPEYDKAEASLEQATDDQMMVQDQSDHSLNAFNLKLARLGLEPIPGPGSRPAAGGEKAKPNPASTDPGTGNNFVDYLNAPQ